MSQYREETEAGTLVWGYDAPLSEYFIQLIDSEDEMVWAIANRFSMKAHPQRPGKLKYNKAEMLEVFTEYSEVIPKAHIEALVLDIPF